MKRSRPVLVLFIFLSGFATGLPLSGMAQLLPQPERITDRQGLPQAFVPSIVQDRQGFIWVATRDGLCRYDGHRFKVFQPDPNGRPSLSFAGLEQLVPDSHGRIWIVSERGDIDIFDPRTETFVNFSRQPAFRRFTKGGQLRYRLRFGRQDRLWLMPLEKGLIGWDLKTNKGQWFRHDDNRPESLSSDEVKDVAEGTEGLWLATGGGLDCLNSVTRHFTHYRHQTDNPRSLPDNQLTGLCRRPNGDIILMSRQHLSVVRPHTGQLRTYPLSAQAYQLQSTHFTIDRQGTIYFNKDDILFRFTDQTGIQVAARGQPEPTDAGAGLFIDQTNVLWVGTAGAGIRTYDLEPNPFLTRRYSQNFYLDLLTSGALGLPAISPSAAASLHDLVSYNFRSAFDVHKNLWFNVGSSDSYRLDLKTGRTEPMPLPVTFRSRSVNSIPCPLATDPLGQVWAVYDGAAFWYDKSATRWIRFPHPVPQSSYIKELVIDQQGLWLASWAGGLWRVDRQTGRIQQFTNRANDPTSLSSNSLYCVSADPTDANRLWIGTFGNGLCLFDKRTGTCRRSVRRTGAQQRRYSAIPDRQGNLWLGTNKGLCRMNRRTFATQTFTRDDGILADEFNSYHYLKFPDRGTADGQILMGGLEGVTVFDPAQIRSDRFEPFVELTELTINNPARPSGCTRFGC